MASHLTIPLDSSDISFHAWPASMSLALLLSLALFLASNIKAILVVSRCLLTSFRYRQPSNEHQKPPIPHTRSSASSLLHLRFLFFCPRFLPPLLYSSTLTPVPSACDAISPLNPALHIRQVFFSFLPFWIYLWLS